MIGATAAVTDHAHPSSPITNQVVEPGSTGTEAPLCADLRCLTPAWHAPIPLSFNRLPMSSPLLTAVAKGFQIPTEHRVPWDLPAQGRKALSPRLLSRVPGRLTHPSNLCQTGDQQNRLPTHRPPHLSLLPPPTPELPSSLPSSPLSDSFMFLSQSCEDRTFHLGAHEQTRRVPCDGDSNG